LNILALAGSFPALVHIGASLSGIAAGENVDRFVYAAAFLALGAAAFVAATVFAVAMPETAELRETQAS
jgi:sugar phosphate permease